jgi:hypothetical protein
MLCLCALFDRVFLLPFAYGYINVVLKRFNFAIEVVFKIL